MKTRRILTRIVSLACLLPLLAVAGDRPNIILIMTDDQGYGDLGATGNPVIRTPHIDAMAKESASMTTFYVSPVCSPTRASLMTGRYNHRTRVIDTFKGRSMMDPAEVTIAEMLKDAGYATGIFGKWHLGDNYPMRPNDQGFEEALIHKGGGLAQPSEPIENGRRYTDPILFHNGKKVATKGYCTDVYFDAAMKFIDKAKQDKRPFFAYIPPNAPHGPYHDVPEDLLAYYKSIDLSPITEAKGKGLDTVARVFAMVENVDQNVGRLRKHLKKLKLEENTIVIFMVDNGPNTRRYVGPFRGMKSEVHDGGIRSPFFMKWPARLKPGTKSDRLSAHIDLTPTLLDAAGVNPPKGLKLDGVSFLPDLLSKKSKTKNRHIVLQTHRGNAPVPFHHFAIRNNRWKLLHPTGFGKEEMPADIPFELYDVRKDPGETTNLADEKPEMVQKLKKAYQQWLKDVSSTRPDNFAPPRIVVGNDKETESVLSIQDWRVVDGTGWGNRGTWLLKGSKKAHYDIEITWKDKAPESTAVVTADKRYTPDADAEEKASWIRGISLPKGLFSLRVEASNKEKLVNPYQVTLHRR